MTESFRLPVNTSTYANNNWAEGRKPMKKSQPVTQTEKKRPMTEKKNSRQMNRNLVIFLKNFGDRFFSPNGRMM